MKIVALDFVGNILGDIPLLGRKMWMDLEGKPYVWHIIERLKKCKKIDEILLFSQDIEENKEVVDLCSRWNLNFRFSVKFWDWEGFFNWNKQLEAEIVILNISFSPLIDPDGLGLMIEYFISNKLDYLESEDTSKLIIINSKIWQRLYELEKHFETFRNIWPNIVKERKDLFKSDTFGKLDKIEFLGKNSLRWYPCLRKVYNRFYQPGEIINLDEVLSLYEQYPEWFEFLPGSQIEIEITNDCNLKCIMCPRISRMNREIGCMDFDLFKKIINEIEVSSIHFSGLGEPLLHPQIRDMFAYAKEKGLEVGLWTNGLELTKELSEEIIDKGFLDYIIFGLDAATKETYAKIKGVDAFDKAVENITRFLKLKKEKVTRMEKDTPGWWGRVKPIVGIQILKMKENDAEIEQFMDKWNWMDKIRKMINYRNRSQELSKIENEGERSLSSQKLNKELWETFYAKAELPVEHAIIGHFNNFCGQIEDRSVVDVTPLKRFSCRQLENGLTIFWNGDVTLCRQDFDGEHPLGNLKEQSLDVILESNRLEAIWQTHKAAEYDKLPLCKDCKEWYYNLYA